MSDDMDRIGDIMPGVVAALVELEARPTGAGHSDATQPCSIDGCDRQIHNGRGWCRMHYFRWRRSGDPGEAAHRKRTKRLPECIVDGCSNPDQSAPGYCSMHYTRLKRHGSIEVCIPPEEIRRRRGAANRNWVGDAVGYGAAHERIRRRRGPARDYVCVDCGVVAQHWSYDHADPNQKIENGMLYSVDIDHYEPRCIPCHKVFDLTFLAEGTQR